MYREGGLSTWEVEKVLKKKEALYTNVHRNKTNTQMKYQLAHWQESKTILHCFPNKRDFKFSGNSDQSLVPIYMIESDPERFSFWANGIFVKKQALFDCCVMMQSYESNCKVLRHSTVLKRVHIFGSWVNIKPCLEMSISNLVDYTVVIHSNVKLSHKITVFNWTNIIVT